MPLVNRFPQVGTNTPLTCVFMTGFEYEDEVLDGVQSATGPLAYLTATPHKQGAEGGSTYIHTSIGSTNVVLLAFPALKEFVAAFAARSGDPGDDWDFDLKASSTLNMRLNFHSTSGTFEVRAGNGDVLTSSLPSSATTGQWNWMHWWGKCADSGGFSRVRVGNWDNLVVDGTGLDTSTGSEAVNQTTLTGFGPDWDDVFIFARSMYYTNGDPTPPTVGATLTGTNSAATATITHVFDNGAGDGCVFVTVVSGTFELGEPLTAGAWDGEANHALGNDEDSLWVPELYQFLEPLTADAAAGFDNTTGGNHFSQLIDADDDTFVDSETPDQVDSFETVLAIPSGSTLWVLGAAAKARMGGTSPVTNIRVGVDDGATAVDSSNSPLTANFEKHDILITKNNPNTGVPYTGGERTAMKARLVSKA